MPGHLYVTQGLPEHLLDISGQVASAMGYSITQVGPWTLKLTQGYRDLTRREGTPI